MTNSFCDRPVVILISADIEWKVVADHYQPARMDKTPYGNYFLQTIDSRQNIFFHGGWGKINAAGSTQFAISRWNPGLVVNLGTCGGFSGMVELYEVILVNKVIVYDLIEQMGDQEEAIHYYTTEIDLSFLREPYPQLVRKTVIVSGDRDLQTDEISDLNHKYGAVAGDWESGAIAYVSSKNNVPCLILRGVSDLVGKAGGEVYDNIPLFSSRVESVMENLLTHLGGWIKQSD